MPFVVCKVLLAQDVSLDRVPEVVLVEEGLEVAQWDVIFSDHSPGLCYNESSLNSSSEGRLQTVSSIRLQSSSLVVFILHNYPLSYVLH